MQGKNRRGFISPLSPISKKRMGGESLRKLLFESQYFGRLVEILFTALIAPDLEVALQRRARGDRVGLAKRNSMLVEKIHAEMSPMVLAKHHPDVMAIGPHFFLYGTLPACFAGSNRRCCGRDGCIVPRSWARRRAAGIGETPPHSPLFATLSDLERRSRPATFALGCC